MLMRSRPNPGTRQWLSGLNRLLASCLLAVVAFLWVMPLAAQHQSWETTGDRYFDSLVAKQYALHKNSQYAAASRLCAAAMQYAGRKNDEKMLAISFFYLGNCYTFLNQYDSARYCLDQAIAKANALKYQRLLARAYNGMGVYYNFLSDNARSIDFMLKCAEILEGSQEPEMKAMLPNIYSNIGYIFDSEKQFGKAFSFHQKAYHSKHYTTDTTQWVMIYQNFFVAYLQTNQTSLARKYLDSASMYNQHYRGSIREVYIRNNYGIYFEALKDTPRALIHYLDAYRLCDSINSRYFQSTIGLAIARLYQGRGQRSLALQYALESFATARQLINYADAAGALKLAADIARSTGNLPVAMQYLDSFHVYTDSLNALEIRKSIVSLESRYQAGQREKEIALLRTANAEKELSVLKRNRLLTLLGVSVVALLLVLMLVYRNSRQRRQLDEREKIIQQQQISFLEKQQQVVSMQSMVNGQETERTRIAKDLHDGLGGLFSTIKMHLSALEHEQQALKSNTLFRTSYDMVHSASEEIRRIAHNMMPEVLIKIGLVPAVQELGNSISAGKLLRVSVQAYGMEMRLNPSTEIMLFRIIQELLNNIIKHAYATEAIIQFNREGSRLTVTVEDNGRGFNLQEADGKTSAGLSSVQSRVHYLNGQLSIDSQEEVGTTIMMDFLINA